MSTSHAILELVEEITNCLDNNKYSIGVVDHDVLTTTKISMVFMV